MQKNRFTGFLITSIFSGLISAGLISSVAVQAAPYDLIDLGQLEGKNVFSYAINNLNEVTGTADGLIVASDDVTVENPADLCPDNVLRVFCTHAFLFSNSEMIDLGELSVSRSYGFGINDSSTVVGYALEEVINSDGLVTSLREAAIVSFSGGNVEAIPYAENTNLIETTQPQQRALDISNSNKVVGYTLARLADDDGVTTTGIRPYIYDIDTGVIEILPTFSSSVNGVGAARSINESGLVVGWSSSTDEGNPVHALLWDPTTPELSIDIGTLGGFVSEANDINDNGIIVGVSETTQLFSTNERLGFIYDPSASTPMIKLPEFSDNSDFRASNALAINNSNLVVGTAQFSTAVINGNTAFLYDYDNDVLVSLNDMVDCSLNWELYTATDINNNGYITGTGIFEGESRSFMLVPTEDTEPTNCTALRKEQRAEDIREISESAGSTSFLWLLLGGVYFIRRKRS